MTDWADETVERLLDHTPDLKGVPFRKIFAEALREERERAISACESQKEIFASNEYATPQPLGGLMERFACDRCISAIRGEDQ